MDRKQACSSPQMEECFLDEGSPTMVEKGMDPSSVFEMDDDDENDNDNGIHDVKDGSGGGGTGASEGVNASVPVAAAAPHLTSASETAAALRHRRRNRSAERTERTEVRTKRESWIDPPEERESTTLTQAEIESCMQTFEVRRT